MKKLTKLLVIALILVMTVTALAGCNSSSTSKGGNEVETVTLYLMDFNKIPEETEVTKVENSINSYIAETYPDANVALDLKLISMMEYADKCNLAMQGSGDIDIYLPLGFRNDVANGQLLAIDDLLEQYGQDAIAILEEDQGENSFAPFKHDGKIYGIPLNKALIQTPALLYNKDMLEATGYTEEDITDLESLEPIFAKLKECYPDVYCFTGINAQDSNIMEYIQHTATIDFIADTFNTAGSYMGVVVGENDQVVNLFETEAFEYYVSLLHDWYLKGYLPLDLATSTSSGQELFNTQKTFCCLTTQSGKSEDNAASLSAINGLNVGVTYVAPEYFVTADTGLAMGIASTSKHPEAAMKMLNIIYTDETVMNGICLGIEGEHWIAEGDHNFKFPDGMDENSVPYTAYYSYGVIGSEKLIRWPVGTEYQSELDKLEQNKNAHKSTYFGFVFDPTEVSTEMSALQNVYAEYVPGLICGNSDPATVLPQLNKALYEAGLETVIAAKQTQLNEWLASQG